MVFRNQNKLSLSRRQFLWGAGSLAATLSLGRRAVATEFQPGKLSQATVLAQAEGPADVVYLNGTILTIDDDQPTVEAVAVKDGRILAVGDRRLIEPLRGDTTEVIDLQGKTMLPGFVDSHGHAYMIGLQATTANLLPPPMVPEPILPRSKCC